jgi:hypothetical protein
MADPLDALRRPSEPVEPRPAFAAELRDEVARTRQILNELDLR